jgi:hypothetical protein
MVAFNPDQGNYLSPRKVLHAIVEEEDFPKGDVQRIEVAFQASGEVAWRVWAVGAEFPVGGVYANSDTL